MTPVLPTNNANMVHPSARCDILVSLCRAIVALQSRSIGILAGAKETPVTREVLFEGRAASAETDTPADGGSPK